MMLLVAFFIIAVAVYLIVRRVEVRLVLLGAGLLMSVIGGKPLAIFDTFTKAMVTGMVAPICAAMGFAAVLKATECDRHLVQLLLTPVRRFRWLVVPGGIISAYLVNMAIPSQTSTAAALGPILVPLIVAAGFGLEVAGAALVLGASFGGDLLNPGAQDVQALSGAIRISAHAVSTRVIPASIAGAFVTALVFTLLNRRRPNSPIADHEKSESESQPLPRLHLLKALIPLVPIMLLLVAYYLQARMGEKSPLAWLLNPPEISANAKPKDVYEWQRLEGALPVVRAMLIGALLAAAVGWREIQQVTRSLFEGMGSAYANIISLTITALCFGAGIEAIGVSSGLVKLLSASRFLAPLFAASIPWTLAVLSGSGSSPILVFAQTFLAHLDAHYDLATLGAIACLAGAFGRTMSPVAAVVVYGSGLVSVSPLLIVRCLLPALLAGAAVALATIMVRG